MLSKTFLRYVAILSLSVFILTSFRRPYYRDHWVGLFNGKDLTGWNTWLAGGHDSDGNRAKVAPLGLNNDPRHVFSVIKLDGENVIRISGEGFGGISTKQEFENYHLQLQFKWGKNTWGPKKGKKRDSGLLYHSVGAMGADGGAWMRSQEFQIEETNTGEFWGCAGAFEDIHASRINDTDYVYDPAGQLYTFRDKTPVGRHCWKRGDAEKPSGEWNTIDLYCHGDTSIHVVNGTVMMVLLHSQQWDNGAATPLTKGKLQLQTEGAEVYYKNIRIEPLKSIPANLLQ